MLKSLEAISISFEVSLLAVAVNTPLLFSTCSLRSSRLQVVAPDVEIVDVEMFRPLEKAGRTMPPAENLNPLATPVLIGDTS